jgi:hypothetical protein
MSEVKFTDEELNKLKDIQQSYVNIQVQLGQVGVSRIKLEQQLVSINDSEISLREKFEDTTKEEQKFLNDIREKYGDGELNPETGVFTKKT